MAAVWALKDTQDLLCTFDIAGHRPELMRRHAVGLGDDCCCQGIGFYGLQGGHRFDSSSVAILPDGRVALSFMDSTTRMAFPPLGQQVVAPGVAIEGDTTLR